MDIPFMIAFPTDGDRVLSATHVHPSRSTTYELVATLHSTQFASERFAIEVIVERFDTLPAWGMFAVPQTIRAPSSDHIVDMTVSVPRTCIGPLDTFSASVTISGNPDWLAKVKKVKLDKIVITIDQIVTYKVENSFDPFIKTKRIAESSTSMAGVKIFENPVTQIVSLRFPAKDLRDKSGFLDKQASISSASAAFTTKCALYSVEFQATIRATFKGARDTVATQPIVVSQYTLKNSETILENIEASVYENADLALVTGVCGEISIDASRKSPGDGSPNSRRRTLLME